jgi:hypothetical protein
VAQASMSAAPKHQVCISKLIYSTEALHCLSVKERNSHGIVMNIAVNLIAVNNGFADACLFRISRNIDLSRSFGPATFFAIGP